MRPVEFIGLAVVPVARRELEIRRIGVDSEHTTLDLIPDHLGAITSAAFIATLADGTRECTVGHGTRWVTFRNGRTPGSKRIDAARVRLRTIETRGIDPDRGSRMEAPER